MLRDPAELVAEIALVGRAVGAVAIGALAFSALATCLGALFPRRPVLAVLVYLLVVEGLFGHLPAFVKAIAISFHLRVLAGLHQGGGAWEPNPTSLVSAIVLVSATALLLWLASIIASSSEYRMDK
jgi:hypothetical protein